MEEMIPELEEMERVGILDSFEVKELIRRRKQFEYKFTRREKKKEHLLDYIQYERNLITFVKIRRKKIGYDHKEDIIENAINKRIHYIFCTLCNKWATDVKLWLSHLDWLKKEAKWKNTVSKRYMKLLQVHSFDPKLWVAAAKYEFEDLQNADSGRQILLRGLRFHPESKLIHREYVKFELLYVEKLRARQKVLKIEVKEEESKENDAENEGDKGGKDSESENENGSEAEETKDDKATVKIEKSAVNEVNDRILNCDLVNLVIENALNAIPEPEFAVSLLMTARMFNFTGAVEEKLLAMLKEKYGDDPITVDTFARIQLEKEGKACDLVESCLSIYRDAIKSEVEKINNISEDIQDKRAGNLSKLIHLAAGTVKELMNKVNSCDILLLNSMLEFFELGHSSGQMAIEEYEFYLHLINIDNSSEFEEVLEAVLVKYPSHQDFWRLKLEHDLQNGEFRQAIEGAHKNLSNQDLARLWNRFMEVMTRLNRMEDAYQYLEEMAAEINLAFLRVLYLDRSYEKGIDKARMVYKRFQLLPPFSCDLHKNILTYELEQKKVDREEVRKIYEIYSQQFGEEEIQIWLDWIKFEEKFGNIMEVPNIVCRAESRLKPDKVNKFNTIRLLD